AHGKSGDTNNTDLRPETTQESLARGYAVIVPDHTGARMAYAEPYVAAHVVLDAVRAAASFDRTNFGAGPIAMLGYSGGAIATNATAKLVSTYAPELA
ncbi:lipase, partial [Streptomyces sp. SID10244]|nr:lipase [Streptomyces sp. SID10244]